jgi:hypothetical protein
MAIKTLIHNNFHSMPPPWPLIVLVVSILVAPLPARADDAYILDVLRGVDRHERLTLSARLVGAFSKEIVETVASGAPVTFTYTLRLERERPLFWDETIREVVIRRTVKFDTLTKEYLSWEKRGDDVDELDFDRELAAIAPVEREENDTAPEPAQTTKAPPPLAPTIIRDAATMERWMSRLDRVDMGAVGLEEGEVYHLSVRCEMKSIKLIPPFNYILFFVALLDFDTDWADSAPFMRGEAPLPGAGT